MTDPIADMFTRIRNGYLANQMQVLMPWSKFKETVARLLAKEDFLQKVAVKKSPKIKEKKLQLTLKYINRQPAVTEIERISKPSRRFYQKSKMIRPFKSGLGVNLISTPKGVMTGKQAQKEKLGGEIIGKVW
jgi:small subunit ribosomal protein S8